MWEESKGLPQSLFWFANTSLLCACGLLWGYHTRCEQGQKYAWAGHQCCSSRDGHFFPSLYVCLCSHFVPNQEILKMSPKSHPRNTRKYLFRLESEGCHEAELFKVAFFASKYLNYLFSFILNRYQFPNGVLTLGPYLRFSGIPQMSSVHWDFFFCVSLTIILIARGQNPATVSKKYWSLDQPSGPLRGTGKSCRALMCPRASHLWEYSNNQSKGSLF